MNMRGSHRRSPAVLATGFVLVLGGALAAQAAAPTDFIKNVGAAQKLGKALFWDEQSGGDGRTACATCHFNQGVDARVINTVAPGPNGTFDIAGITRPGQTLTAAAFPFGKDDKIGSQGVVAATFRNIVPGSAVDNCTVTGVHRQVTGRQAPSVFQAERNIHNFWDGRANNIFNGVDPSGRANRNARIFVSSGNKLVAQAVQIEPAAMASQAVGPPNNGVEMSCAGRIFPELGRKMLSLTPLGQQHVDATDSVLGRLAWPGTGLNTSYTALIQAAFNSNLWNSTKTVPFTTVSGVQQFSQTEANFSLFWGLAIQEYVKLLVPHNSRFDRWDLDAEEELGLEIFTGEGRCVSCHRDTEPQDDFTAASRNSGGGGSAFVNTGVRPVAEDSGVQPAAVGEFKTPTVRNAELSGPYFHNGGHLTLMQVVDFYDRGGDFPSEQTDSHIRPLGLTEGEKRALVAFMLALTDDRARINAAPFDHPDIDVPNFGLVQATGAAGDAGNPARRFLGADPFAH